MSETASQIQIIDTNNPPPSVLPEKEEMPEETNGNAEEKFAETADPEMEELMKAGIHLGHAKTKDNPAMKPYIFGIRNTISLIDLAKTKEKLRSALDFIKKIVSQNGTILLVGTRPAAKKIIKEVAEKTDMPYFVERWVGGALTNFKEIAKRVEFMERLEEEKRSGEFEKFPKKEQMEKTREIEKLNVLFGGIRGMKKLPNAIFIVDINEDDTAVREARRLKIPIVALCDTNSNAKLADYCIPSNDDALPAVRYMALKIGETIEEGKKQISS